MKKLILVLSGFIIISILVGCGEPVRPKFEAPSVSKPAGSLFPQDSSGPEKLVNPLQSASPRPPETGVGDWKDSGKIGPPMGGLPGPAPIPPATTPAPPPTTPGPSLEPPVTPLPPTPALTPAAPSPAPSPSPVSKPVATPALNAARDLTGTWAGSGVFYQVDEETGERVRKINVELTMTVKQTDNEVNARINFHFLSQDPAGKIPRGETWVRWKRTRDGWVVVRRVDEDVPQLLAGGYVEVLRGREDLRPFDRGDFFVSFKGTIGATTMSMQNDFLLGNPQEKWEFTFTTDLMSGGVKPVQQKYSTGYIKYLGFDSDPKAFNLTRQK